MLNKLDVNATEYGPFEGKYDPRVYFALTKLKFNWLSSLNQNPPNHLKSPNFSIKVSHSQLTSLHFPRSGIRSCLTNAKWSLLLIIIRPSVCRKSRISTLSLKDLLKSEKNTSLNRKILYILHYTSLEGWESCWYRWKWNVANGYCSV